VNDELGMVNKALMIRILEVKELREALRDIRDLARTGIAPMSYNMTLDEWRQYKLDKIAGIAAKYIQEEQPRH